MKDGRLLYEIDGLTFFYPEEEQPALDGLSLSFAAGGFYVLCGPSGCGKTTLLRHLKPSFMPAGGRSGRILFDGRSLLSLGEREAASKIGYVLQSPENQVVTDRVWHELAFGLEGLGLETPDIRKRVAEMASFFGMEDWFHKKVEALSGGQKQLLALASIMVMQPEALLLDEPTAQLDPIAAGEFMAALGKINRELGTTIILTEHRLEEAFAYADAVYVMERGRVLCNGSPSQVGRKLQKLGHPMSGSMPTAMQVYEGLAGTNPNEEECPVTIRDGRAYLERLVKARGPEREAGGDKAGGDKAGGDKAGWAKAGGDKAADAGMAGEYGKTMAQAEQQPLLVAKEIGFRYEGGRDILKSFSLSLYAGEFYCLLGGNGAGKSTALKVLAGLVAPHCGEVLREGRIGVLPQNPQTLFVKKTVREDLLLTLEAVKAEKAWKEAQVAYVTAVCRLGHLLDRHPYDLSGGEQQRAALAKVLLLQPELLLLDEPTKGLDGELKEVLAGILYKMLADGVSILMVSHDVEFCAKYAHRCGLLFDGMIVSEGTPGEFFPDNSFYTTGANRMAREFLEAPVTVEDILRGFGGELPARPEPEWAKEYAAVLPPAKPRSTAWKPERLPWWRRLVSVVAALAALGIFLYATGIADLTKYINASGLTGQAKEQLWLYPALIAALVVFMAASGRKSPPSVTPLRTDAEKKLSARTRVGAVMILLCIPLTIACGVFYLGRENFGIVAVLVLLESMLPFFMIFEGRRPRARELAVIAVLCGLGVAGRSAFFMLPQFKPVMALTIIAGAALGGETGFLVGAMTMLVSNLMFGQGPWTPWQMFAMGIIGFLAGLLFQKGLLRRSRLSLSVFGGLSAVVIYGGIMNPATVLIWTPASVSVKTILAAYVTGLPMDLIHAFATIFFLWVAAEPMLEKLERIKVKYGYGQSFEAMRRSK